MNKIRILWADDEIDLLKPHILFLEKKGYEVTAVNSGDEAIEKVAEENYDIVFLDENMPGTHGIEALQEIKKARPSLPVIMITKSEEEHIMEDAIGSKINDFLIKPVNPNQLLLSLKKNLDSKRLVSEKSTSDYQRAFREISMKLSDNDDINDWYQTYKEIIDWEIKLSQTDSGMDEILHQQKEEANRLFSRFIGSHYEDWFSDAEAPTLSHQFASTHIKPLIEKGEKIAWVVIDNLRFDQFLMIRPHLTEKNLITSEGMYTSILPTATHYARNALFAGMTPKAISEQLPDYWKSEQDEGGKNLFEKELCEHQLKQFGFTGSYSFHKIANLERGKRLEKELNQISKNQFVSLVYNFVDMLSHARTEMEIIKELASDEKAYRSLTLSWYNNSPLKNAIDHFAKEGFKVVITTDHGTIRVKQPTMVKGFKDTNTNLRYKTGNNLSYESKDVFDVKPEVIGLPKDNINNKFIFAKEDGFFLYPNRYNYFKDYYLDTFQHGGISMEEMLIPYAIIEKK